MAADFPNLSMNDEDTEWISDFDFGDNTTEGFSDWDFYKNLSPSATRADDATQEEGTRADDATQEEGTRADDAPVAQFTTTKDCELCNESESSLFITFNSIYLCDECLKRVCPAHIITFLDATAKKARTMCYVCWDSHRNVNSQKSEKEQECQSPMVAPPSLPIPESNHTSPTQKSKMKRRKSGSALGKSKETTSRTQKSESPSRSTSSISPSPLPSLAQSASSVSPPTSTLISPKNVQPPQHGKNQMGLIPTAPVNKNMIKFKNQNK